MGVVINAKSIPKFIDVDFSKEWIDTNLERVKKLTWFGWFVKILTGKKDQIKASLHLETVAKKISKTVNLYFSDENVFKITKEPERFERFRQSLQTFQNDHGKYAEPIKGVINAIDRGLKKPADAKEAPPREQIRRPIKRRRTDRRKSKKARRAANPPSPTTTPPAKRTAVSVTQPSRPSMRPVAPSTPRVRAATTNSTADQFKQHVFSGSPVNYPYPIRRMLELGGMLQLDAGQQAQLRQEADQVIHRLAGQKSFKRQAWMHIFVEHLKLAGADRATQQALVDGLPQMISAYTQIKRVVPEGSAFAVQVQRLFNEYLVAVRREGSGEAWLKQLVADVRAEVQQERWKAANADHFVVHVDQEAYLKGKDNPGICLHWALAVHNYRIRKNGSDEDLVAHMQRRAGKGDGGLFSRKDVYFQERYSQRGADRSALSFGSEALRDLRLSDHPVFLDPYADWKGLEGRVAEEIFHELHRRAYRGDFKESNHSFVLCWWGSGINHGIEVQFDRENGRYSFADADIGIVSFPDFTTFKREFIAYLKAFSGEKYFGINYCTPRKKTSRGA